MNLKLWNRPSLKTKERFEKVVCDSLVLKGMLRAFIPLHRVAFVSLLGLGILVVSLPACINGYASDR